MNKTNYQYYTALVFVLWIIIWESLDFIDPILNYGGIFVGIFIIGTVLKRIEPKESGSLLE